MSVVTNLHIVIKSNPLQEKIVIANNHAQGLQWKEWISRELGPVSNVTIQTIGEFVYDYGKLGLRKNHKKLISSTESYWLIYALMNEIINQREYHFEANLLSPGFVDAFYRAIQDLRHAGVPADSLSPSQFEQEEKGKFIKHLLVNYENYLYDYQLVDLPGLLPYLSSINSQSGPIVLVHEHVHLSFMEQNMLEKVTSGQYEILKGDRPFFLSDSEFPAAQTEIFHATGILSELREGLRRLAKQEAPLDEVEWIASDYEGYVSAAYALSQHYGIPMTYSKGLPLQYSTIGKAAYRYINWLESNFHIDPIIQAFKDSQIQLTKEAFLSKGKIVTALEKLGIGWGQERYALIEKAILNDEQHKPLFKLLAAFFQQLFEHLPKEEGYSPKVILDGLTHFLETYCPPKGIEEASIFHSIRDLREQMGTFAQTASNLEQSLDFVKRQLEGIRFQVTPIPEPGKLHFSSIHDGGYSGRQRTSILGMDAKTWSVNTRQDPILLDDERQRISKHLQVSSVQINDKITERNSRLAGISKTCTMSFCSYSPLENDRKQPAYEMLQVFRIKYQAPDADMSNLFEQLGEPVYFSGATDEVRSNETEAWLQSIIGEQKAVKDAKRIMAQHYKPIAAGDTAISSRKGTNVTSFDGWLLNGVGNEMFDSLSFSATQLERFAECSLKFYFQDILGIRPKKKKEFDRTSWLTSLERGSLIHAIFFRYIRNRIDSGKIMEPHDRELLQTITNQTTEEFKEQIPVPSAPVAQKEIMEIYKDIEVFISQEEKRSTKPKYLELQIHPEDGYLEVEISEGIKLPLTGYVDRVDEIEPHVYRIYDYKTGNPKKFEDAKYFAKGRQLQHALYALAVEQYLRKNGTVPDAVVRESVYYFPTQKGLGKEVVRTQNRRELLAEIIERMLDAIQKGTFLPTNDPNDCRNCDFKEVCGDHAKWRKEKLILDERFESILGVSQYD